MVKWCEIRCQIHLTIIDHREILIEAQTCQIYSTFIAYAHLVVMWDDSFPHSCPDRALREVAA
jgi:hypothetical protein